MADQSDWLTFIQRQGAIIKNEQVVETPASLEPTDLSIFALTDSGLIDIAGPDASKFLQGQVTCDIEQLSEHSVQLGGQCNPKGRAIFSFLVAKPSPERVRLRLPAGMMTRAQQSLGKYMVFSKAEFETCDNPVIAIMGQLAKATIERVFGQCPSQPNSCAQLPSATIICAAEDRFELWLNSDSGQTLWSELFQDAKFLPSFIWYNAEINAGIATVQPETSEEFIPQNMNFVEIGAVSFSKGCYTGQEVVARMHYLGKQKRHMRLASLATNSVPRPGSDVTSQDGGQSLGKVVNACANNSQTCDALVYITDTAYESNDAYIDGVALTFKPLPYPLRSSEQSS
ncbi:YgfZ/GcvT domain-containing protein [Halioxenophilus aromaticivorans]|uniref:Folate-binding protein YgfZ n=1 Tax=Halioxenophilus aromaticivorans TaxID=1306992 RepID=A0AAV3TWM1_9ALTE